MKHVRHLISLDEASERDLINILEDALELEQHWQRGKMPQLLAGHRIALIVDDDGWRNTLAFDLGIQSMGGTCVHAPIHLGVREEIGDVARYLQNWFDAIVVRTPQLAHLRDLAGAARIPVINARTKSNHPCETLADLAFVLKQRNSVKDVRIAVVSPASNILESWIEASRILPIHVTQVFDTDYLVEDDTCVRFSATDSLELAGVDLLVTDAWPDDANTDRFIKYQITADLLEHADRDLVFLPCPPVHRGREVTVAAMDHATCRSFEAKACLLHAQNSVLKWVFAD